MLGYVARSLLCLRPFLKSLCRCQFSLPPPVPAQRCCATMAAAPGMETVLAPLRVRVQEQGDLVRRLKEQGRPKLELQAAVAELKARKKALEQQEAALSPKEEVFDRNGLEDLLKRRFFYTPSFAIYGGVGGLYDFGPIGCAMKSRLIALWRSHFVLEDSMLEVDCSVLTPERVLKASGHMDRFSDLMVKDLQNGEHFRADHLLRDHLERLLPQCPPDEAQEYTDVITKIDSFSQAELEELFHKYSVRAPVTNNPLSPPMLFNLMFATSIGPGGAQPAFMRPETAQGIFVNFKRLLEFNNGKLPFGAAQIGRAFRNEISPRSGLLRVREFEMAEIEYFVNPKKKATFPKFSSLADLSVTVYSAGDQMQGKSPHQITLGDAVREGVIANETLAYFLGRIHQFLVRVGVAPTKLRFRQHMGNEMAHYATDCWDAECKTSYGWVECVGCADRSAFDLTQHSKATKVELTAKEDLAQPRTEEVVEVVPDKGVIGKQFRKEAKLVLDWLSQLDNASVEKLQQQLQGDGTAEVQIGGKAIALQQNMLQVKRSQKTVHVEDVVPAVVEPSFGVGRILYTVLEHSFRVREEDKQRVWLAVPPAMAPISCSVLPLSPNQLFNPFIAKIVAGLKRHNLSHRVEESSVTIGRRYARTDEIGIPFGVTVDFDTLQTSTVTLRERDSTRQVRIGIDVVAPTVSDLVAGHITWTHVEQQFPVFTAQESTPRS